MIRKAALMLCFITTVSALQASPIAYNLSFTLIAGDTLPTAGSFTYDSSLAVNPFSAFTLTAGGGLVNLTSAANGFTGNSLVGACKSSQSAAGFFNGLTGAGCLPGWVYIPVGGGDFFFQISVCSLSGTFCDDGSAFTQATGVSPGSNSFGSLTVTAATATPEPGALWLSGIGVLALMSRVWVQRRMRNELMTSGSITPA